MEETKTEGNCTGGGGVLHGRYELGRLLGKGSFAKVHLAKNLRTGQKVAMKIFSKEAVVRVGMRENVMREISLMKMVSHPNIVELHEVLASRSKIYLAMELLRGGELFAKILSSGRLPEDGARRYFRQLISAVDFCHSRGVYHRDLKLENLLLDEMGNLKVADFGLSAFADHVGSDGLLHTTCGSPAYVAPEVLLKRGYDGAKVDIWSCGVILFALLAGFLPFADNNRPVMCKKIISGDFKCPPRFSGGARRLIMKMLDPNPSTRITIAQLVESSWFKKDSVPPPLQPTQAPLMKKNGDEPMHMNAFHLISLSEGFDLSPLFHDKREEGMRFATTESAEGVVSRLEGLAATGAGNLRVTKSSTAGVRLEGEERGRKGRLAVAAEIFTVAPQVLLVEVRMDGGDALEYGRFCSQELRPALKDIVWASSDSSATV